MKGIQIIPRTLASSEDIAAAVALGNRSIPNADASDVQLLARYQSTVVGVLSGDITNTCSDIFCIAVHQDFQRRGIGRALLSMFMLATSKLGVKHYAAECINNASMQLFRTEGFSFRGQVAEKPPYSDEGEFEGPIKGIEFMKRPISNPVHFL